MGCLSVGLIWWAFCSPLTVLSLVFSLDLKSIERRTSCRLKSNPKFAYSLAFDFRYQTCICFCVELESLLGNIYAIDIFSNTSSKGSEIINQILRNHKICVKIIEMFLKKYYFLFLFFFIHSCSKKVLKFVCNNASRSCVFKTNARCCKTRVKNC